MPPPIDGATRVTVLRHGAVAGRAQVCRGALEEPLSAPGWRQMEAVARAWRDADIRFDAVASSPLSRCRAFAEVYARDAALPLRIDDPFREIAFGAWEGLTASEAAAPDPALYQRFRAGDAAPPGGEHPAAFRTRVVSGWQAWLADAGGGRRLLVTHAGVMRVLLAHLLDLPPASIWRIALPEAAQFEVSLLAGEMPVLLSLNACAA
jgi:alpha-ribazole phosphatase